MWRDDRVAPVSKRSMAEILVAAGAVGLARFVTGVPRANWLGCLRTLDRESITAITGVTLTSS